jgi:hypothetical protein
MSQVKIITTVDEENNIKLLVGNTLDNKPHDSITKNPEDMDLGQHHRPWLLEQIRFDRINRLKRGYANASKWNMLSLLGISILG